LFASKLTPLQTDVLHRFFRIESHFFLTGGAALAGFHLGHRETADLDLFTTEDALDAGERALRAIARDLGATVEEVVTAPDFRRRILRHGPEGLVVDLVREWVAQGDPVKMAISGVRVDPPGEILANKLCTLLSRAEPRDLVDVMALERAGFRVEDALALAQRKDGGATPGQLAWVISQIRVGEEAPIPGGYAPAELREYLRDLHLRLSRLALPSR